MKAAASGLRTPMVSTTGSLGAQDANGVDDRHLAGPGVHRSPVHLVQELQICAGGIDGEKADPHAVTHGVTDRVSDALADLVA